MGDDPAASIRALLCRDPARTGVFLDFDGTLAPVVDDPARARPLEQAVTAVTRLADRIGRVAVISGRPLQFLRANLPPRLALAGLYGLETLVDGTVWVHPEATWWRAVIDEVVARARAELPDGVGVEHKGLSVTLHYRTAPDARAAVERLAATVASETGLHARPARASIELHPPLPVDKGTMVEELGEGLDAVCFVGDDRGDLDAFDGLDRLARRGTGVARIGVRSSEAPAELLDRADLVLEGPAGVAAFLDSLAPLASAPEIG